MMIAPTIKIRVVTFLTIIVLGIISGITTPERLMAAPKDESKVVLGMVLLNDTLAPDYEKILIELKSKHKFKIEEHNIDTLTGMLVVKLENSIILMGIITEPIESEEIEYSVDIAALWPSAKTEVAQHRAHVIVTVLSQTETKLDMYRAFTKVASSVLTHSNAQGIYIGGQTLVLPKDLYIEVAASMTKDNLPLYNWIYFGLITDNNRISGYTYGLKEFGFDEIEILNSTKSRDDVLAMLFNTSHYIILNNIEIKPGDTFGMTKDHRTKVTRSNGVYLEGKTLKLEY